MTEPRPSFLRVWVGFITLMIITVVPGFAVVYLIGLLPVPWWLQLGIVLLLTTLGTTWMLTSRWVSERFRTLSRWSGMLP